MFSSSSSSSYCGKTKLQNEDQENSSDMAANKNPEAFNQKSKSEGLKPNFDYYIHGTTSAMLPLLPKTQFELLGPVAMLEKYCIAPLSGEIRGGGLDRIGSRCDLRFGRLYTLSGSYTLTNILKNYTKPLSDNQLYFSHDARDSINKACSTINQVIIALSREKQYGTDLSKFNFPQFFEEINATIQIFYLLILLGEHIHPDYELLREQQEEVRTDMTDSIYTHLTQRHLLKKIISSKVDIQSIYEAPSPKNLEKIVSLLELPKDSVVQSGPNSISKRVSLPATRVFGLIKYYDENSCKNKIEKSSIYLKNFQVDSTSQLNSLLENFALNQINPNFFSELKPLLLEKIRNLKERYALLKTIYEKDDKEILINEQDLNVFVKTPFPIILMAEKEQKIVLYSKLTQEYVAQETLKMGEDITAIATDTEENRILIKTFLTSHGLDDMHVFLFNQLEELNQRHENNVAKEKTLSVKQPNILGAIDTVPLVASSSVAPINNLSSVNAFFEAQSSALTAIQSNSSESLSNENAASKFIRAQPTISTLAISSPEAQRFFSNKTNIPAEEKKAAKTRFQCNIM